MNKILHFDQLTSFTQRLTTNDQRLILVGGCFDILHIGHIHFLEKSKDLGDQLVVLLESDTAIKKKKGPDRPINTQLDRAKILTTLHTVDFVILLPEETCTQDYADVTKLLKPAIIATTKGDPQRKYKEICASLVGAEVVDAMEREKDSSTTKLAELK